MSLPVVRARGRSFQEGRLSSGVDKRERKLGGLAFLRNLRNMKQANVDESLVLSGIEAMNTSRVLPFRFLAAARYAPQWEETLEHSMLKSLKEQEKLRGGPCFSWTFRAA